MPFGSFRNHQSRDPNIDTLPLNKDVRNIIFSLLPPSALQMTAKACKFWQVQTLQELKKRQLDSTSQGYKKLYEKYQKFIKATKKSFSEAKELAYQKEAKEFKKYNKFEGFTHYKHNLNTLYYKLAMINHRDDYLKDLYYKIKFTNHRQDLNKFGATFQERLKGYEILSSNDNLRPFLDSWCERCDLKNLVEVYLVLIARNLITPEQYRQIIELRSPADQEDYSFFFDHRRSSTVHTIIDYKFRQDETHEALVNKVRVDELIDYAWRRDWKSFDYLIEKCQNEANSPHP